MVGAPLRPDLTQVLASFLLRGESVNLTAPHGFGRRRTLHDLRQLLAGRMHILLLDMKVYADDCAAALRDIVGQAGLDMDAVPHFGRLLAMLAGRDERVLLIMHNIDLLRGKDHDRQFDNRLLPYLKDVAGYARLALLTVSEDIYADWPLPCRPVFLPPPGSECRDGDSPQDAL